MGTLDLPFRYFPKNQKHYLFCDSTWNLWSSHSQNMTGYTSRLLREADALEKKSYEQMEHIFTISNYVKINLIEYYGVSPDKITVVGTGLGVIKPYTGEKNYSNKKILFAAKNRFEDKGGELILKAFNLALEKDPELELIIVGQPDYNNINIPNVKTYGFIPIEQLQEIFNDCSLFLMPALNEPWGLVYLEALACKMPIVGLNRNSFPEISGNGKYGFGLDNLDSTGLANTINNAFSKPELLKQMGIEGQKFCLDTFSWKNTVSKIINSI
ncbi:MAG: glycosyltransferase family 4 protein [Prevotella sp.]|jgi:glycosyltransferase involved in cell wall biosynthesis|nr:glycosyltransferase family 4 protein [Prevotella sp.]